MIWAHLEQWDKKDHSVWDGEERVSDKLKLTDTIKENTDWLTTRT